MNTKQTIAIIGATGSMGTGISTKLSNGNYRLLLLDKHSNRLEVLFEQIRNVNPSADIEVSQYTTDACWEADIIILALPYAAQPAIAEQIREVANQKIVISIANPINEAYDGLVIASGTSAAEELQKLLPNSKVIKVFNIVFAADCNQPVIAGKQADAFIAGNDDEALQTVSEFIEMVGFNPVIAGGLRVSRTLEGLSCC